MQCFFRLVNRDDHETLDNENKIETVQILLMFFHFFIDVKFNNHFLDECKLDGFMRVPMTFDDKLVYVPDILSFLLEKILRQTKRNNKP